MTGDAFIDILKNLPPELVSAVSEDFDDPFLFEVMCTALARGSLYRDSDGVYRATANFEEVN